MYKVVQLYDLCNMQLKKQLNYASFKYYKKKKQKHIFAIILCYFFIDFFLTYLAQC